MKHAIAKFEVGEVTGGSPRGPGKPGPKRAIAYFPGRLEELPIGTKLYAIPDDAVLQQVPAVKVDRTTRYGNPWRANLLKGFTATETVATLRRWLMGDLTLRSAGEPADIRPLRGKNLACRDGEACHVDVYLELSNQREPLNG
jgi:hypothetical protein